MFVYHSIVFTFLLAGGAVTGTGLGLGGTLATTNTTISSIFNTNSSTAPLVTGLGGVDPKKKTFGSGNWPMCSLLCFLSPIV